MPCAGSESGLRPAPYGTGDVIGVTVDVAAGSIVFYKNGAEVARYTGLRSAIGQYWPFVALDMQNDRVEALPGLE